MQKLTVQQKCCEQLAWRLGLRKADVEEISAKMGFVLVEDLVYKISCIHDRREARVPLIIEGETGGGKTFNMKFYSCLGTRALAAQDWEGAPRGRFKKWLREEVFPKIVSRGAAANFQKELCESDCTVEQLAKLWRQILEEWAIRDNQKSRSDAGQCCRAHGCCHGIMNLHSKILTSLSCSFFSTVLKLNALPVGAMNVYCRSDPTHAKPPTLLVSSVHDIDARSLAQGP